MTIDNFRVRVCNYTRARVCVYIAKSAYRLSYEEIQEDVKTFGPVEASFEVYDDFVSYKSGTASIVFTRPCRESLGM